MRAVATMMAGTALVASVGLHLTGFTMMPTFEVQIEGGAPMQLAMLGNSFADMTEGAIRPVTTEDAAEDPAEKVDEIEPAKTRPSIISPPVTPLDLAQTPQPTQIAPAVAESRSHPVIPLLAATPDALVPIAPVKPLETLRSKAPVEVQPAKPQTRRPVTRAPKPAPPRRKQATAAPRKPQGGNQATRRGQADGSAAGKATSTGQGSAKARAAGNAAASNYPGLVMRKISRTRKQRAGARGKATVAFKVSASGAATSVRIIRSSGSAKVDQVALRHIQRASPFPRPPKGARRSFSVVFVSKS